MNNLPEIIPNGLVHYTQLLSLMQRSNLFEKVVLKQRLENYKAEIALLKDQLAQANAQIVQLVLQQQKSN